jgi:hypothetical protein
MVRAAMVAVPVVLQRVAFPIQLDVAHSLLNAR